MATDTPVEGPSNRQAGDLAGPPLANPDRLHDGDGCMIYRRPESTCRCGEMKNNLMFICTRHLPSWSNDASQD